MKFTYNRSTIMRNGHRIARYIKDNGQFNTYREALAVGLKKAWQMAKGFHAMLSNNSDNMKEWVKGNFTYEEAIRCGLKQVPDTYVPIGA